MDILTCIYIYTYTYAYIYIYTHSHTHAYAQQTHVYIYIYTHTHTHTHTYIRAANARRHKATPSPNHHQILPPSLQPITAIKIPKIQTRQNLSPRIQNLEIRIPSKIPARYGSHGQARLRYPFLQTDRQLRCLIPVQHTRRNSARPTRRASGGKLQSSPSQHVRRKRQMLFERAKSTI
jgi:hypothetical protein